MYYFHNFYEIKNYSKKLKVKKYKELRLHKIGVISVF